MKRPRLGVVVIFDQMRATDIDRYGSFFEGGFGGLYERGAARYDAQYTYANTETAPGHATISTGANPNLHGIVSNYWFTNGQKIYAVDDIDSAWVNGAKKGSSAKWLMAPTLGDAMKIESNGTARVVSLSLKDRAAILSIGKTGDLAVWYDRDAGEFTSSKAYGDKLPPWLDGLAKSLPAKSMREGKWSPLPTPKGLEALVPDDPHPNESGESGWTDRFPHDLSALDEKLRKNSYLASPHSMEDLFKLALAAVDGEELGRDVIPDLLVVSISSTDYVSHGFGPTSREMLDMLRRADSELRAFLAGLDQRVGRDNYALVLASDHASTPLPEIAKSQAFPAGRIAVKPMLALVDKAIEELVNKKNPKKTVVPTNATEPKLKWVRGFAAPHVYLNLDGLSTDLQQASVDAARSVFLATDGISAVYTPQGAHADEWWPPFAELVFGGRNGQLMVRHAPRWLYLYDTPSGTDHGSPYNYDNRIAFFVLGPDVRGGRYAELRDVRDISPTLAFLLHAPRPDYAQGKPVGAVGR